MFIFQIQATFNLHKVCRDQKSRGEIHQLNPRLYFHQQTDGAFAELLRDNPGGPAGRQERAAVVQDNDKVGQTLL